MVIDECCKGISVVTTTSADGTIEKASMPVPVSMPVTTICGIF